jgi:adenine deaminase
VAEVAEEVRALDRAYGELGTTIEHPFMMVSFLSLGAIHGAAADEPRAGDGREFALVDPVVS